MILKNKVKENFSMIPNEIIEDKLLSNGAFRLLLYLFSKPDNWKIFQSKIATDLEITIRTVKRYVNELKRNGYLEIEQISNGTGFEFIYKLSLQRDKNVTLESMTKMSQGQGQKCPFGRDKNVPHNNTISNNTISNNTKSEIVYFADKDVDKLFKDFLDNRDKKKNTDKSIKMLINKIKDLDKSEQIKTIENSIASGWSGLFPKTINKNDKNYIEPTWLKENTDITSVIPGDYDLPKGFEE